MKMLKDLRFMTRAFAARPATYTVFTATIVVVAVLGWQLALDLSYSAEHVTIGLLDYGNHTHAQAHIIAEKRAGKDHITVSVSLSGAREDKPTFALSLPVSFKRMVKESELIGARLASTYKTGRPPNIRYWIFSLAEGVSSAHISQTFKGDVLSGRGLEFQSTLYFGYLDRPIPTRVTLTNLSLSSISFVDPPPRFRSDYALDYSESEIAALDNGSIRINLTDRGGQMRHSVRVIIFGVAFGVCGSIIATFVLELAGELDARRPTSQRS